MHPGHFISRVVCPEQDSLHPDNQSELVALAEQGPAPGRPAGPKLQLQGMDLLSDSTDPCGQEGSAPSWMLLYTSFLHSCSPCAAATISPPIPLYRLPAVANGDHKQIIKWQEDWEACGSAANERLHRRARRPLHEIGEVGSRLQRRGSDPSGDWRP